MAYFFFNPLFWGYSVDVLALLRIVLAILAIYYYTVFGSRREEAKVYQYKTMRLTFVFFALESGAEFIITALGATGALLLVREIGRLGISFTVFRVSQEMRKYAYAMLALPFVFTGIFRLSGLDIDVFSLISMALVLLTVNNYTICHKTRDTSEVHKSARNFFLLSLLAYYAFLFIGVLLGIDLYFFAELPGTLAVALGLYSARSAAKFGEG